MNELTEQDRKALTAFLGECWHELFPYQKSKLVKMCSKCMKLVTKEDCHTFTTADDMVALKDKLVEVGKWEKFENASYVTYERTEKIEFSDMTHNPAAFSAWLFTPSRFAWLVSEWLKGKERL